MLRFDKVIKPQGFVSFRVAYTVIFDDNGLYLIQTGSGFPPEGFTAGRGVARVLSKPIIAMRTQKYFAESERVEQQINQRGYHNFPVGKRGVFLTRNEIKSAKFKSDKYGSFIIKLKTAKGKFTLAFYSGLHDRSALDQFVLQLSELGFGQS